MSTTYVCQAIKEETKDSKGKAYGVCFPFCDFSVGKEEALCDNMLRPEDHHSTTMKELDATRSVLHWTRAFFQKLKGHGRFLWLSFRIRQNYQYFLSRQGRRDPSVICCLKNVYYYSTILMSYECMYYYSTILMPYELW